MYRLINETQGIELGEVDSVRYIRTAANGCFIQCTELEATGIAFESTPYNYNGNQSILKQPTWDEENEVLIEPTEPADTLSVEEIIVQINEETTEEETEETSEGVEEPQAVEVETVIEDQEETV